MARRKANKEKAATSRGAQGKKPGRRPASWQLVKPEEVRRYRESSGLSRAALARALGVSTSSILSWENGKVPSLTSQRRLRMLMDGERVPAPENNGEGAVEGEAEVDVSAGERAATMATGAIVAAYLRTQKQPQPGQVSEVVRRVRRALAR